MTNMNHPTDLRLIHREVARAALTSTATLATIAERASQRTSYRTLVNVESIKITANNELYKVVVECSNDGFTTVEVAEVRDLGATEVRESGAPDSAAGDTLELLWATEINGTKYAASRIRLVISGTAPSIGLSCRSSITGSF